MNKKNCRYYEQGRCLKGELCTFSHTRGEVSKKDMKTKMCKYFEEGKCAMGENCSFSHTSVSQLIREITGYPGWVKPDDDCQIFDISFGGDNPKNSSEVFCQPVFVATLNGRIFDKEFRALVNPIYAVHNDLVPCLLILRNKICSTNFDDDSIYEH